MSCGNSFKSDEKGIINAFNYYKQGVLKDMSDLAFDQLSSKTINYYDNLAHMIQNADSVEISKLEYSGRMIALTVLATVPDETLISDGRKLFKYLLSLSLVNKASVIDQEISTVKVNKDFGVGYVTSQKIRKDFSRLDSKNLLPYHEFYKEDGRWKLDLVHIMKLGDRLYTSQMDSTIEEYGSLDVVIFLQTGNYPKYK